MKKYKYANLDINVYKHVCKNGLEIYMAPNNYVKSFYVTLNVKYGSNIIKFKLNDELINIEPGSAHFLEHKMFEQESGVTPFNYYSELGIDCNASTNNKKTDYIFSGNEYLEDSLNFLLNYVQEPFFTDKNVEKEKGIIEQEILMYDDEPSQRLYDESLANAYFKNPIKNSVGGKVKNIMKITKEDLYNIYNAFYQPGNMFLVLTGNFNVKKVIKLIEKNQSNKKFKNNKVEIINPVENKEIKNKYKEIYDNIYIPKFAINIKIYSKELKEKVPSYSKYLSFFLETVLGSSSELKEKLTNMKLITSNLATEIVDAGDFTSLVIMGEAEEYDRVIDYILRALNDYKFNKKEFELNQKLLKSYYVYMTDNIYSVNSLIVAQMINHNKLNENIYLDVDKMNKVEYNYVMSQVDLNNYGIVVSKPKSDK